MPSYFDHEACHRPLSHLPVLFDNSFMQRQFEQRGKRGCFIKISRAHWTCQRTEEPLQGSVCCGQINICRTQSRAKIKRPAYCRLSFITALTMHNKSITLTMHNKLGRCFLKHLENVNALASAVRDQAPRYFILWIMAVDEAQHSNKGANTVTSMLHHHFMYHGLGETDVKLHMDNCSGQNKNNTSSDMVCGE